MLKTIEGVGSFMGGEVKRMFLRNAGTKLAALLVKGGLAEFRDRLNPGYCRRHPLFGADEACD